MFDSYNSDARVEICRRINTNSQRCCAKCWHEVVQKDTDPQLTQFLWSPLPSFYAGISQKATATAFNMLIKMNTVIKVLLVVSMVLGFVSRLVSADDDWCDTTGVAVSCKNLLCCRTDLSKVPTFLNQDVTSM